MGRKIFVSYKYADDNVYRVPGVSGIVPIARDYVTWLENKFTNRTDHIYKGEHDQEDLSDKSEEYIKSKLKDKIYDSSVTIVLISPNMKEQYKQEKNQWIPWEIAYSVRETTRNDFTSHSNAVLAVILPDRNNSYYYYNYMDSFEILTTNIDAEYIPVVKWEDFRYDCDRYIDKALKQQQITPEYKIRKII